MTKIKRMVTSRKWSWHVSNVVTTRCALKVTLTPDTHSPGVIHPPFLFFQNFQFYLKFTDRSFDSHDHILCRTSFFRGWSWHMNGHRTWPAYVLCRAVFGHCMTFLHPYVIMINPNIFFLCKLGFFHHAAKLQKNGSYRTLKNPQTVYIHPSSGLAQVPCLVCNCPFLMFLCLCLFVARAHTKYSLCLQLVLNVIIVCSKMCYLNHLHFWQLVDNFLLYKPPV